MQLMVRYFGLKALSNSWELILIVLFSSGIFSILRKEKLDRGTEVKKLLISGQSIVEYVVIFAIVAVLSVTVLLPKIQGIFSSYVSKATGAMQ
jgi:Flp pilus assembly pilin Flp